MDGRNVLYLDWGGGCVCQNSLNCTLKNLHIVLFAKLTLYKPPQYLELKFLSLSMTGCLPVQIPEGEVVIPAAVATLQISSHPPGAAPARGPFLILALCWHFVNACFSLSSLGAHGRHSSFFPLALLQISSSLCLFL